VLEEPTCVILPQQDEGCFTFLDLGCQEDCSDADMRRKASRKATKQAISGPTKEEN